MTPNNGEEKRKVFGVRRLESRLLSINTLSKVVHTELTCTRALTFARRAHCFVSLASQLCLQSHMACVSAMCEGFICTGCAVIITRRYCAYSSQSFSIKDNTLKLPALASPADVYRFRMSICVA